MLCLTDNCNFRNKQRLFNMNSRCVLIFLSTLIMHILHSFGSNETTKLMANHTTNTIGFTTVSTNYTADMIVNKKNETKKKRTVLIINNGNINGLRTKHRSKRAKTLLYEERDDMGNKLKTYMMKNLDDVAQFFKEHLDTEICNVQCADDDIEQ